MIYGREAGTPPSVEIDACPRPADSFRIEVPATADRLAHIRHQLTEWLQRVGVSGAQVADIVLAVNEACSNCVEHAYRDTDTGTVIIEAAVEERRIAVCVTDFGAWRPPSQGPTTRGRGLSIMDAISDGVRLESSTTGTTVRIGFEVGERLQDCGSRTT